LVVVVTDIFGWLLSRRKCIDGRSEFKELLVLKASGCLRLRRANNVEMLRREEEGEVGMWGWIGSRCICPCLIAQ
jgi:hypothetical protein